MHFTRKENNVQAFVNLHIRLIILFCRQYFLQQVFVRFYFLVNIAAGKVTVNFTGNKGFHILLSSDHILFMIEKLLSAGADVPGKQNISSTSFSKSKHK